MIASPYLDTIDIPFFWYQYPPLDMVSVNGIILPRSSPSIRNGTGNATCGDPWWKKHGAGLRLAMVSPTLWGYLGDSEWDIYIYCSIIHITELQKGILQIAVWRVKRWWTIQTSSDFGVITHNFWTNRVFHRIRWENWWIQCLIHGWSISTAQAFCTPPR